MNAFRALFLLAALGFAASCAPPAQEQSQQQQQARPISLAARSEMDRINAAASLTMPARPEEVQPATDGESAAPQTLAQAAAPGATPPATPAATPEQQAANVAPPNLAPDVRYDAGLVRLQVLLDRAHISPGVIDGYDGDNVRKAIKELQARDQLTVTGIADQALLQNLTAQDAAPALVTYTITANDVRGPFVAIPSGLEAESHLQALSYESPQEELAERFHMDADLLARLNPGANFAQAGAEIVVANAGGDLTAPVASIEVDKQAGAVRARDASGQLLAFYPASIGSADTPAPSGDYAVRAVAFNPVYSYDPARLPSFGQTNHGALTIPPGPNNPVGAVWIALTLDTYGIHGTPDPSKISKTQSHGCVRLTNWDALELAHAVRQGVPVHFIDGMRQAASPATQAPT